MDEPEFQTSVDQVFEFIKSNKRVTVKQVAKAMSRPIGEIEELVKILEGSKLIEVSYGFNDTFLTYAEEKAASKKASSDEKNAAAELESLIDSSYKVIDFAKKDFVWRLNAIETLVSKLENEDLSIEEKQKLGVVISRLTKEFQEFEAQNKKMLEDEKGIEKKLEAFKTRLDKAQSKKSGGLLSGLFKKKAKPPEPKSQVGAPLTKEILLSTKTKEIQFSASDVHDEKLLPVSVESPEKKLLSVASAVKREAVYAKPDAVAASNQELNAKPDAVVVKHEAIIAAPEKYQDISTSLEKMPNYNKLLSESNLETARHIGKNLGFLLRRTAANRKKLGVLQQAPNASKKKAARVMTYKSSFVKKVLSQVKNKESVSK